MVRVCRRDAVQTDTGTARIVSGRARRACEPAAHDNLPRAHAMSLLSIPSLRHALALAIVSALALPAQAPHRWSPGPGHTQLPIWPTDAPNATPAPGPETMDTVVERGTTTKKLVGGRPYLFIENVSTPTITVYRPTGRNSGAAVIVYPGGGFSVLAMDIEGTEACEWLGGLGVTCVLLKYRVPCAPQGAYRECPSAHQDAQRAMRIVRSRARDWRIDPNRIGVMGFSAGAHMAIMASTRIESSYPPVDAMDSVSSRPDFALVLYPGRVAYRQTGFVPNPAIRVSDRTPPTFLVQAYDDDLNPVENTLIYAAELRKASVPTEVHVFATGGHAFGLRRTGSPAAEWPRMAAAWLRVIGVLR